MSLPVIAPRPRAQAGRLANGPGYLDVSVSTRLDELKQRASGQVRTVQQLVV